METAFDGCADLYEAHRPGYPAELFEHLARRFALTPGSTVIDLGAGTGRATALLAERGYQVIAVEPSPAMRARGRGLEARYPARVRFVEATAEATGLDDGMADLVTSAQAFHWFDPFRALPEAARVLKPGAGLALFWNNIDQERTAIGPDLKALIKRFSPSYTSAYHQRPWIETIEASRLFANVARTDFYHAVEMTGDTLCGLARSYSYVHNVLDQAGLAELEKELRRLVSRHYGEGPFPLVYRTELYAAARS